MVITIILYLLIGAVVTFAYKYVSYSTRRYGYYKYGYCEGDQTATAICSGVFWPVFAPFSFAILFARLHADKKEKMRQEYD